MALRSTRKAASRRRSRFPGGAHVAEVEIDPETGAVEIASYVAVDDCGRVMNHTLVEGQLHGGIVQGIGQALAEHCVYDAERAAPHRLVHGLRHAALGHGEGFEALRSLGAFAHQSARRERRGRSRHHRRHPAVANAVIDALRPLGIDQLDFPYSPNRIWQAIAKAKRP